MIEVNTSDILRAGQRARRYRQQIALDVGAWPGVMDERICFVLGQLPPRPTSRSGWYEIGMVYDGMVERMFAVYWHPASDRVQVERQMPDRPSPTYAINPIWWSARKMAETDPGYRFWFEGNVYDAREAARVATKNGNIKGWTWERIEES